MKASEAGLPVRIWKVVLRLDDFLWFASYEWAGDNETAAFLHGYALSFALSGTERIVASGVPQYQEDLDRLDVYCTPARLLQGPGYRQKAVFTFNSVDGPTQLTQAMGIGEKVNDPKIGRRQVLVPGLRFEFVAFTRRGFDLPRVFRLGKKRSPVVREEVVEIGGRRVQVAEETTPSHAVNPLDVTGRVTSCIPQAIPPHLVFEEATIAGDHFVRDRGYVVHVPVRVRAWESA